MKHTTKVMMKIVLANTKNSIFAIFALSFCIERDFLNLGVEDDN